MSALKIGAILLIVAGILGLVYGGFSYNKETHSTTLGPIAVGFTERQTVNVPVWAGAGAIVAGSLLLLVRRRSTRP